MRYSGIFGKTNKTAKEYDSVNATLLIKAGFIDMTMAGGYSYLTLGVRVLEKIERIIREEMNTISSEVLMPCIVPTSLWEATGRIEKVDVLMKTTPANTVAKEKHDTEYILSPTHEEVVTPLSQKHYRSYKEFPISVYQINTKFRNEPRAKSGLLRCREFRMKDMYSFHTSEADLKRYYDQVKQVYWRVYERIGIRDRTYLALASGGDFTDDYSHEYQTRCETREDLLFHVPSKNLTFNREVAPSKAPPAGSPDEKMAEPADFTGSATGVEELARQMGIPVEKTVKTLLYEDETGKVYAVALRGNYEADEEKIKKVTGANKLVMASGSTLQRLGTVAGYIGAVGLPDDVTVLWDESTAETINFEIGGNKKDLHRYNLNWGRDIKKPDRFYDLKVAQDGDLYPETGEQYEVFKASEVGNIFPLYTKFSDAFDYKYIDENGTEQQIFMGCYGIGPSRMMGVIAELFHDEKGLIWPEAIAPFRVHLLGLNLDNDEIRTKAEEVYKTLTKAGVEVLFDDRTDVSPGNKFGDSDLIGIPWRVVVSKRTGDQVEIKRRNSSETSLVDAGELVGIVG